MKMTTNGASWIAVRVAASPHVRRRLSARMVRISTAILPNVWPRPIGPFIAVK